MAVVSAKGPDGLVVKAVERARAWPESAGADGTRGPAPSETL